MTFPFGQASWGERCWPRRDHYSHCFGSLQQEPPPFSKQEKAGINANTVGCRLPSSPTEAGPLGPSCSGGLAQTQPSPAGASNQAHTGFSQTFGPVGGRFFATELTGNLTDLIKLTRLLGYVAANPPSEDRTWHSAYSNTPGLYMGPQRGPSALDLLPLPPPEHTGCPRAMRVGHWGAPPALSHLRVLASPSGAPSCLPQT